MEHRDTVSKESLKIIYNIEDADSIDLLHGLFDITKALETSFVYFYSIETINKNILREFKYTTIRGEEGIYYQFKYDFSIHISENDEGKTRLIRQDDSGSIVLAEGDWAIGSCLLRLSLNDIKRDTFITTTSLVQLSKEFAIIKLCFYIYWMRRKQKKKMRKEKRKNKKRNNKRKIDENLLCLPLIV